MLTILTARHNDNSAYMANLLPTHKLSNLMPSILSLLISNQLPQIAIQAQPVAFDCLTAL